MRGIEDGAGLNDVTAALASENDELKDRVDQYAELAQIGLALGMVQHQFTGQVRIINKVDIVESRSDRLTGYVKFDHLVRYLVEHRRMGVLGRTDPSLRRAR